MKPKLLIFPGVLFFTFIIAYSILAYFSKKNELLLEQTKNIYFPSVELSIKLDNRLSELQRTLQNLVATGDEHLVEEADSIAASFIHICSLLENKSTVPSFANKIDSLFNDYYHNAKATSISMISSDFSSSLEKRLNLMLRQYNEIERLLNNFESKNKEQVQYHFISIETNNKRSAIFNFIIVLLGFSISLIISYFYSKAIAKPLKALNQELKASQEELIQLNEELSSTNDLLSYKNSALNLALAELKSTQLQLVQSEKMASIGILTAGIAHEINNPLNFIQGGILAVEDYVNNNLEEHLQELNPLLTAIITGINRTNNIIRSLNEFNRKVDNNSEFCDLHKIINNCLAILNNKLKDKVIVNKKYSKRDVVVIGNEGRLHQAFLNILINAEQAIETKGEISIKTELIASENKVKVVISDNGCGIKQEILPRINEPFFTTKEPGKGTGLGLSIVYNIIKEHKGSINYLSEEGKGTSVIISLPSK
jgi:signal transduction histidine kinase